MKELEIRTTGELMLGGAVVATVTFSKPYVEDDVAGIWHPEGYSQDEYGDTISSNEDLEDTISDLEDEVSELKERLAPFLKLDSLRSEHATWSRLTFGTVSAVGPSRHLSMEALEVAAEPLNATEHADCWMLLWDMQRRAGISDDQLADAIRQKLKVNRARKWPAPLEGEAREHDRSAEVMK